ncbi:hypothetical protein DFH29DRAFT_881826 [Suillus ampliporus]|nr:hypothetical protein DFH29DRAFT_881826 [Suillus ampliporus]
MSADQVCTLLVSIGQERVHRHIGHECNKARHRWRQRQGAQEATLNVFDTLDEILSRTYTGGSCHHNGCQARVGAVLQDIDARGWSIVRPEFLEQVSEATALLNDAEALSTSVANLEARLWLAAEEQILSLMDQEPGALDHTLFNDGLFMAENTARCAAEVKRRCNDNTQDGAPPGSMFHAHMSIDITQRVRHSVKTSYYWAPQAISLPHVVLPVPNPSGLSEALNFDMVDEAYVEFLVDTTTDMEPIKAKKNRTAGDEPMKLWILEQEKILREFI